MTGNRTDPGAGKADPLREALSYAARGWAVFPTRLDKAPATPHGFKDASSAPNEVEELWRAHPGVGVGIRTGAGSGLVVLDVDPDKGGDDSLHDLERRHGELPETIEVLTGGGGRHIYFAHPGEEVRNSAGKLGVGLDVRGDGGYVVAPPSRHPRGRAYEWKVSHHPDEVALAPMPGWMLEALRSRDRIVGGAEAEQSRITEGQRNTALTSLAGSLRRPGSSAEAIRAALAVTNEERCDPPLPGDEVAQIAASVARYQPADEQDASSYPFEVETAREICQLPEPPATDELLGSLLVRGARMVLGAHTGEGKTTLALQMVRAVEAGIDFLGWRGRPARVLVIDAEQGLRTIKRRLREAGLSDSDRVDYLRVPDGLQLDADGADAVQLEELLRERDYGLVVADPLYKLHRGDSNEERHAVDLMRRLDRWRTEFHFALLMLVHVRKRQQGGGPFTIDDLFGSSAYLRGAEVVLGLRRPNRGYAHLHFFKDRDGDLPVGERWGLLFDRENGFRRDPDDGKEKETAADKIRPILEAEPGRTLAQLVAATDYSDKTVRKALRDLGAESETGPHNTKFWRLPDASSQRGNS